MGWRRGRGSAGCNAAVESAKEALSRRPASVAGAVLEWCGAPVALDGAMVEALLKARVVPNAVACLELAEAEAVARLFVPAPRPTLDQARRHKSTDLRVQKYKV